MISVKLSHFLLSEVLEMNMNLLVYYIGALN